MLAPQCEPARLEGKGRGSVQMTGLDREIEIVIELNFTHVHTHNDIPHTSPHHADSIVSHSHIHTYPHQHSFQVESTQ